MDHHKISKMAGEHGNNGASGYHPNYCIIEMGQITEESSRDQTPVRNYQLFEEISEENQ